MTKACDGGDAAGCGSLGLMYQNGQGVTRDEFKAVSLYRKACDNGNARGCTDLGWMTELGLVLARTRKRRYRFIAKPATQKTPWAANILASCT